MVWSSSRCWSWCCWIWPPSPDVVGDHIPIKLLPVRCGNLLHFCYKSWLWIECVDNRESLHVCIDVATWFSQWKNCYAYTLDVYVGTSMCSVVLIAWYLICIGSIMKIMHLFQGWNLSGEALSRLLIGPESVWVQWPDVIFRCIKTSMEMGFSDV
jgi:hypothetical protein